jgi:PHD/YefM family antitoxin component YafN of YafNO toxin-antitoxin module
MLISIDDIESLEETLEVLADPGLMAGIAQGQAELAAGLGVELTEPANR